jgi:nucleotide-binding universal stress UspA family protein
MRLDRILVPVANPATACGLVQMASALGSGQPAAEIIALRIVTAPGGMSLDEARHYILPMREQYEGALAQAADYAREAGLPLSTELEVAREAAKGILDYARNLPDLGLILLGWCGEVSRRRVRRSINQAIVSQAQTNVAVLRLRESGLGSLRRVLLPVGWGPHARLGLRLAERLAYNTRAAVTVLRVLPMSGEVDWEGERAALVTLLQEEAPGLRYGTELRLAREPAAVPAILAEAQREPYDLIIVGASDEWWVRTWLFGAIPDQVAERAPCSVLLVRQQE